MIQATIHYINTPQGSVPITQYSQSLHSHNNNHQKEDGKFSFPLPFTIPLFSFPLSFSHTMAISWCLSKPCGVCVGNQFCRYTHGHGGWPAELWFQLLCGCIWKVCSLSLSIAGNNNGGGSHHKSIGTMDPLMLGLFTSSHWLHDNINANSWLCIGAFCSVQHLTPLKTYSKILQ